MGGMGRPEPLMRDAGACKWTALVEPFPSKKVVCWVGIQPLVVRDEAKVIVCQLYITGR